MKHLFLKKWYFVGAFFLVLVMVTFFLGHSLITGPEQSFSRPQVWLIGIDGADWSYLQFLFSRNELPFLHELYKHSIYAPLQTVAPTLSPVVWSTIATGRKPVKHGMVGWIKNGKLLTTNWRDAVPFWELLDRSHFSTLLVNWWATFPVTDLNNGIMVSDRFRLLTSRHLKRPELDAFIDPPELGPSLLRVIHRVRGDIVPKFMKKYGLHPYMDIKNHFPDILERPRAKERARALVGYVRQDLAVLTTLETLLQQNQPDFVGVLFRLIDICGHIQPTLSPYWNHYLNLMRKAYLHQPVSPEEIESLNEKFALDILPCWKIMDTFLERLSTYWTSNTIVLIISDHGFQFRGKKGYDHHESPGYPLVNGIFLMSSSRYQKTPLQSNITVMDIAPLILSLYSIPISRELDGHIPEELMSALHLPGKVKYVQTYRRIHHERQVQKENKTIENELLKDLKTLGYIQ